MHSFNDSKKTFTLASPTGTGTPLSCANSCRSFRNHCQDAQELDNQALNQACLHSKLACVFQGPKHVSQALYEKKKKEPLPFSCQHSSPNVDPHPVMQVPAASRETSNSSPHYTDTNTAPKARTLFQQESLSAILLSLLSFDIKLIGARLPLRPKCASALHPSSVPPSHVSLGGRLGP